MTLVDVDPKMAALFDGDSGTCNNTQEILDCISFLKISRLNGLNGTLTFDVKVLGLDSCLNYEFVYVVLNNGVCDYMKSCNVTHDLAVSHNSCIVSCPHCNDTCDMLVNLYNVSSEVRGSICEVNLL